MRPQFEGEFRPDPTSEWCGKLEWERHYPRWKRMLKYCVTIPLHTAFVTAVVASMVLVFQARDELIDDLFPVHIKVIMFFFEIENDPKVVPLT